MVDTISEAGLRIFEISMDVIFFLLVLFAFNLSYKFDYSYTNELNLELDRFSKISNIEDFNEIKIKLPTEQIEDLEFVKEKIKGANNNIEFEIIEDKEYLIYKKSSVT
jgi:hypothetical protein